MRTHPLPVLAALLAAASLPVSAQTSALDAALAKPILAPNQPMVEAQVYTASRVRSMPSVSTAKQWDQVSEQLRRKVLDEVVLSGEGKRWSAAKTRVEWLDVIEANGYRVKKLRYEAIPGLWVPALLYEPAKLTGKVPVVLNVNGHEPTGASTPYIQVRCINLAKRGVLALNFEWYGQGQSKIDGLNHARTNQIDLTGTNGVGLHFLAQKRALDLLLALPNADPERVAVTGLSGGGWQTILLSALDTRVRLAVPVAGYSSYVTRTQFPDQDLGDSEQTPVDLAGIADYTTLTAMRAPRPTVIINNAYDNCCFRGDYANSPLIWAARPYFALYGAEDQLKFHINFDPGHNYGLDNRERFYRAVRDTFYGGRDAEFPVAEIPSDNEVRTADQLRVPMPDGNLDFHAIALKLAQGLPRATGQKKPLAEVVKAKNYAITAVPSGSDDAAGIPVKYWRLRMNEDWTVPAVELGSGASTVVLFGDQGRAALSAEARSLAASGKRVIAVDPFYFGESKPARRDYLFALLVSSIGDRPLGIQASQIAAIARWANGASVESVGPRTSMIARVAAALEPKAITGVTTHGEMLSAGDPIRLDMTVDKTPELFTFGLLESFDAKAPGWQPLFDGKTGAGWKTLSATGLPADSWTVENGTLTNVEGGWTDILTERSFRNFELEFEWKLQKGTNSGVKYLVFGSRPNPRGGIPKALGLELQLIDDERVADAKIARSHGTGALYLFQEPGKLPPLPMEQWHTARIVVDGRRVEHWLDGVKVLEADLESPELRRAMEKEARVDIPKPANLDDLKNNPGKKYPLSLTHHGGRAWYRNIQIRSRD